MHNITLATLPFATLQQVFEQSATHLLTQKEKSKEYVGNIQVCVYLNSVGLKCAAGCFISEKEYSPSFEGFSWEILIEKGKVPDNHLTLIHQLQLIHDTEILSEWKNALKNLGKGHDLDISFLNNFS